MDIRKSQTGRLMCGALATLGLWVGANSAIAAESLVERANRGLVEVVTGSVNGTSVRMAEDLADALDDGATRMSNPTAGLIRTAGASVRGFAAGMLSSFRFQVHDPAAIRSLRLSIDELHERTGVDASRAVMVAPGPIVRLP